ncbi:MAG: carboxylating nicotinate-nucleotide diphosphorylase [Phycisphaerae bacterium]
MNVVDDKGVLQLIELAKCEDFGTGDLSTDLIADPNVQAAFRLVAKQPGVFAGCEVALAVLRAYDESIRIDWTDLGHDGARMDTVPAELATIRGPLGVILSAERVLLNFLQRLSGIATLTRAYVDATAGTGAAIYDTRKTTPGWRKLEKYAVRCGDGCNHRQGLFDAVLIKDNHLAGVETQRLAGTVAQMLARLEAGGAKPAFVEVEADTLDQVDELLEVVGVDAILLDNFSLDDLREATANRDGCGLRGKVILEASGGITLDTVGAVAGTGVDRISVGAITHSATAIDLSLERV